MKSRTKLFEVHSDIGNGYQLCDIQNVHLIYLNMIKVVR